MLDNNMRQADFYNKKISEYVKRGECALAFRGELCSQTLGNIVVGIHDTKNRRIGLANINNISELESFAENLDGIAKIVGPEKKLEEARNYLVGKGFRIGYLQEGEWVVNFDAKTGCIGLEPSQIYCLSEGSGSADYLN